MSRSFTAVSLLVLSASAAQAVDFDTEVWPILENNCTDCHDQDASKSGFRVDLRSAFLKGGDSGLAAIDLENPESSYLIELVSGKIEDLPMPPKGDQLPKKDISTLLEWIKEGAVWPGQMEGKTEHAEATLWSLQPLDPVDKFNEKASPIDAFLEEALLSKDLGFSEPAQAGALLRRASVILTGLYPTYDEVEAFVTRFIEDPETAYRDEVDRLIASPQFGERWAQHWLDVIRWAETNGSESNLYRKNAWIYRDYVVNAFNNDIGYDRFLQEQLAGDQLGADAATGFLVAGPHVPAATVGREPAAKRQARADRLDEVMQTVGASILGMTVSCARCHNHKFDPISIQDYYGLSAVFQGVEFDGRFVTETRDHPKIEKRPDLLAGIEQIRKQQREKGAVWKEDWKAHTEIGFPTVKAKEIRLRFHWKRVRLDEIELLAPNSSSNLLLAHTGVEVSEPEANRAPLGSIDYLNDGMFGTNAWMAREVADAPGHPNEGKPYIEFEWPEEQEISGARLSVNRTYALGTDFIKAYSQKVPEFTLERKVGDKWVTVVSRPKALEEIQPLVDQYVATGPQFSFVGRFEEKPPVTQLLLRGSPENPRGEVVPAGFSVIDGDLGLDSSTLDHERRLAFGDWVTSGENPLTSRVFVNRVWHHIFGNGIVTTTADFGEAGARPSHPELLDWLATRFQTPVVDGGQGWSVKALVRELVLTQAFQQSSAPDKAALAVDGATTLLWRYPPRRVEAEVLRDSMLRSAGVLDTTLGGESFRIHNVKATYSQWEVVDNSSESTWRRLLYQERMRRVDDQMFTAFDLPDCGQVADKRTISTTPLQALNLMNSDFIMTVSKRMESRFENLTDEQAIDQIVREVLSRRLETDEMNQALAFVREQGLAAFCRVIYNTNEFAFLP